MYTPLLVAALVTLPPGAADPPAPEQEAQAVVQKAVQAHGGAGALAKLQTVWMKAEGGMEVNNERATFTLEFAVHTPGRAKMDMEITLGNAAKINLVRARNRDQTWETVNGKPLDLHPRQPEEIRAWGHLFDVRTLLPLLRDKAYHLSPLGEIKVNGRPAVGVKVTAKGETDIDLYFDKGSLLLVKSARRSLAPDGKDVTLEILYGDYKEADGLKQPWKHTLLHNGKKFIDMTVTEIRPVDKIDEEEFAKP